MNVIPTHHSVHMSCLYVFILQEAHEDNTALWVTELRKGRGLPSAMKQTKCMLIVLL